MTSKKAKERPEEIVIEQVATTEADEQPKNKSTLKTLLFWFVSFVLVVSVSGFLGYKFLLGKEEKSAPKLLVLHQSVPRKIAEVSAPETPHSDMQFGGAKAVEKPAITEEKKPLTDENLSTQLAEEIEKAGGGAVAQPANIAQQNKKIAELEQKNRNLLLFISAQNMQQDLSKKIDPTQLKDELDFFKKVAGDAPEYQAKIDLIEYSLEGDFENVDTLLLELEALGKKLAKPQEQTFWANFQDSIFGLIKVTKLDDKIAGADGDYPKFLLIKKALQRKDYNEVIRLVEAMDSPLQKDWLDKVYKLERLQESVEYLLSITRKNLVS